VNYVKYFVDFLLAILVMFIFPVMNISQRQDAAIMEYLRSETRTFANNVSVHGYLTWQMYESFLDRVSASGQACDIKMVHEKLVYEPEYVSYTFTGKVNTYSENHYEDDILDVVLSEGAYYFNVNDHVTFTITTRNKTIGRAIFGGITWAAYDLKIEDVVLIRDVITGGVK